MQETSVSSLGREDPLEKGMATHSNILSWTIPWAVEPGGLQSMKSQRVRHRLEQLTHTAGLRWAGSKKSFTFTHAIPRIATWWCQMAYVYFQLEKLPGTSFISSIFTRLPGSSLLFAVSKYFQSGFNP